MSASAPLRRTGIQPVGDLAWGSHFCHFFESKQDLLETLVPFFGAGLAAGERCLWVVADPLTQQEAVEALQRVVPHFHRHMAERRIEIRANRDWYAGGSASDLASVIRALDERSAAAVRDGFAGLRVSGSAAWLDAERWPDFSDYEAKVNQAMAGKPILALCSYALRRSGAADVLDVARTHQFALAKRNGAWEMLETAKLQQWRADTTRLNEELQQRLLERTETLEAIFENIPVMISIFDASFRPLRVNREWQKTLGWTLEEAQRVDILAEAYPDPDDRKRVLEFIGRAERTWADFRMRTRDGRTIEASWARFELSNGYRIGFGIDITQRKQAEAALAESEARFARIFQVSPVSLAMSTVEAGRFLDVNQSWQELFGYARDEVLGRTNLELGFFPRPEERPKAIQRFRDNGVVRNVEMQFRTKSGEVRDVMVSAVPLDVPGNGDACLSAQVDITDRKRAEAERAGLLASETQARAAAEAALARVRAIERITDAALSHLSMDELLRELLVRLRSTLRVDVASVRLIDEARGQLYLRAIDGIPFQRVAHIGIPLEAVDLSGPFLSNQLRPPDPESGDWSAEAWRALGMPLRSGMSMPLIVEGKPIGLVGVAATRAPLTQDDLLLLQIVASRVAPAIERGKLVETVAAGRERLRLMSHRLLTAHEEERRRIAVELHDELGQALTAVKINLESLERQSGSAAAQGRLDAIRSVDHAMQRVRNLALDLRPSVLDDLGLPAALRWYMDRFARDARVEAHLAIDAVPKLAPELEIACFRVAQEALTNVTRHARARHVWLELRLLPDSLELRVADDGGGFDAAAARERATLGESVGLLGMQERVALVGGDYALRSAPGAGTEVRARFPLSENLRGVS